MTKYYIGINGPDSRRLFTSDVLPTEQTHGHLFAAVIGPFRTRRGAEFMRDHGRNNPHCQTVADAERLAAREAVTYREGDSFTDSRTF